MHLALFKTKLHFDKNLYHEDHPSKHFLDGIVFAFISLDDAKDLEKDFT